MDFGCQKWTNILPKYLGDQKLKILCHNKSIFSFHNFGKTDSHENKKTPEVLVFEKYPLPDNCSD